MKRSERCCGNCVYFHPYSGGPNVCHRYPVNPDRQYVTVRFKDWCGEHATEEEYERSKLVMRCKQLENPDGSLRQPEPGEALEVTWE